MNAEEDVKRDFQVSVEVLSIHEFIVPEVNSQEEAESVAEEWLMDGEEGIVVTKDITNIDSFPVGNKEAYN